VLVVLVKRDCAAVAHPRSRQIIENRPGAGTNIGTEAVVRAPAIDIRVAATKTIPIVFSTGSDPVAAGWVSSLAHPGGNVTGVTSMGIELIGTRLQLLRDLLPGASRIAVLVNPSNPGIAQNTIEQSQTAARRLGPEIVVLKAEVTRSPVPSQSLSNSKPPR
jgi:ABC-type uncharacterized transport system substrate-binding protein